MTRERAIEVLEYIRHTGNGESEYTHCSQSVAIDMAIRALGQDLILNRIKAEIIEEKDFAYADFERYKVEYLGHDWEDIDCPPQDDFRYGMERAIEIINKYKVESDE